MPTSLEILGGRVLFQVELCYGDTITFSACQRHDRSLYTNSWLGVSSNSFNRFSNFLDDRCSNNLAASSLILNPSCQIYNISMRCERYYRRFIYPLDDHVSSGCNGRIGVRIEESDASNTTVITSSNQWEVCGPISLGDEGGNKLRVCELTVCPDDSVMISFCHLDDARFFRVGDPADARVQLSRRVGESYEPVFVDRDNYFSLVKLGACTRFTFTRNSFSDHCATYGVDFGSGSATSAVMGIKHLVPVSSVTSYLPRVLDQLRYCQPYYTAWTSSATVNSPTCVVEVCPGDRLTVAVCHDKDTQPNCSGETYLRLFDENMMEAGDLYDGCDRRMAYGWGCPSIQTVVSADSCANYTIVQGCWNHGSCGGTVRVLVSETRTLTNVPTLSPTNAPTSAPLSRKLGEWQFCPPVTFSGQQAPKTSACYLEACPGDILIISLCKNDNPGIVSWGDPYLKLMDITTREELADSDDSCGLAPRIEYGVGGEDCRQFEVVEGCSSRSDCFTLVGVLVTAANITPSAQPTAHSPADLHLPRLLDTWQVTPSYFSKGGNFVQRYTVALCPGDRFILSQCPADSPLIEAATGDVNAIRLFDLQTGQELFSLLFAQPRYFCEKGQASASKYVGSSCADVELRVECWRCAGNVGVFISESDLFTGGEYSLGRIPRALDRWIVTEDFHQLTTREILSPVRLEVELCPGDTVTFSACDRYEDSLYLAGDEFAIHFPGTQSLLGPTLRLSPGCANPSTMILLPSCQNYSISMYCRSYNTRETDALGSASEPSGCHGRVGIYISEQAGDPVVIESINQWEVCGNISLPDGGVRLRVCEMDLCPGAGDSLEVSFCSLDDPRFFMNGSDYRVWLGRMFSGYTYKHYGFYLKWKAFDDGCKRAVLPSDSLVRCGSYGIDFSSSSPTSAVMGVKRLARIRPTVRPTLCPTAFPSIVPTTSRPSHEPTSSPTSPTAPPSTALPSLLPSATPSTRAPTENPSQPPYFVPSRPPTFLPTAVLSSVLPSKEPTFLPRPATARPSLIPSRPPTTVAPSFAPTAALTQIQASFSLDNMNLRDMSAEEVSVLQTSLRESIAATTNVNETAIKNLTLIDGGAGAGGRRSLSSSPRLLVSFLVEELSTRLHDSLVSSNHTSSGAGSGGCGGPASSSLVDLFRSLLSCGGGSALLGELKTSIAENLGQVNGTGGASSLLQAVQSATIGSVVVVDRTPTASPTRLPSLAPEDGAGSSSSASSAGEGMMLALEIAIPLAGFFLVALVVGLAYRCLRGPSTMKVIPVPAVSAHSSSAAAVSSDRYHVTHDRNNISDDGQQDSGVSLFSP